MKARWHYLGVMVAVGSALAGCHDGKSNSSGTDPNPTPDPTYTVSGTVSGLTGTGLVLDNNGASLDISSDGNFAFADALAAGASYNVTVTTQPTSPDQMCTVANGSGVANANVSNVAVTCSDVTYTLGGTVSGLAGTGLVLTSNGINLPVSADGSFTFADPLAAGATYDVTVTTQPGMPAQVCTVANATGTAAADVSNVTVTCATTPLTLSGSTPASGAVNVARDVVPTVTFSAALDGATVPANLLFKRGTHTVPASVSTSVDTVTVTPQAPLSLYTTYSVSASAGLLGQYGEPVTPDAASFTTVDGVWHGAQIGKVGAPNTSNVEVAFTSDGNAIAVWYEYDGPHTNLWANIYTVGTGWGTAQELQASNNEDEVSPKIATDAHGHAVVVWSQNTGVRSDIWSSRYTVGSGWGSPTQISSSNVGTANDSPMVAMNANGDTAIAWVNTQGGQADVWARYQPANAVMDAAARIESADGNTGDVKLVIDAAGNATALWMNYDAINNTMDLWSNTHSAGSWGSGSTVESSTDPVSEYSVAVDGNGVVIAGWSQQLTNSSQGVYTSRFDAGAGWSSPTQHDATVNSASYYPTVVADADGNAMIVWGRYDNSVRHSYSRYQSAGGSWTAQELTPFDVPAELAFDASGNALAVYSYRVTQNNQVIQSARFTPSGGWETPLVVTPGNSVYAEYAGFAIDAFGGAVAAWIDYDLLGNTSNIAGSRFDDSPLIQ